MQSWGGADKVYYGRCANGELENHEGGGGGERLHMRLSITFTANAEMCTT